MKRITTIATILFVASQLSGLTIGTDFFIGNMAFADDRTEDEIDLPALFPWGGSIVVDQQVDEQVSFNLGFYSDSTLNYISYTLIRYSQQFFAITVGPFFGFFNSPNTLLKPGISTSVRADIPGIAFVSFRADSSIGGRLAESGDYLQERSDVSVGFYVRNAILSVNLLTKSYIYRTATQEIIDGETEYSFETDLFQKNVPFRILLSFAYQERTKSFIDVDDRTNSSVHRLRSAVLGTELELQLTDWLLLEINLDSSLYSFGDAGDELLSLPATGIGQFLFTAGVGAKIDLDGIAGAGNPL